MDKKKLLIGIASAVGIGVAVATVAKIICDRKKMNDEDEFDELFGINDDEFEDEMGEKFEKAFDDQKKIREEADTKIKANSVTATNQESSTSENLMEEILKQAD